MRPWIRVFLFSMDHLFIAQMLVYKKPNKTWQNWKTTISLQILKDLFSPLTMYAICSFHFTLIFCQALERTVECYIPFHVPIIQFIIKISVHIKNSNLLKKFVMTDLNCMKFYSICRTLKDMYFVSSKTTFWSTKSFLYIPSIMYRVC